MFLFSLGFVVGTVVTLATIFLAMSVGPPG
jgi:hypothetical protein